MYGVLFSPSFIVMGATWLPSVSATTISLTADWLQQVPLHSSTCTSYFPPCVIVRFAAPLCACPLVVSGASEATATLSRR